MRMQLNGVFKNLHYRERLEKKSFVWTEAKPEGKTSVFKIKPDMCGWGLNLCSILQVEEKEKEFMRNPKISTPGGTRTHNL